MTKIWKDYQKLVTPWHKNHKPWVCLVVDILIFPEYLYDRFIKGYKWLE